jgi:hypothetical protein
LSINRTGAGLIPAAALIAASASCGPGSAQVIGQSTSVTFPAASSAPSPTDTPSIVATTPAPEAPCTPDNVDVSFGGRSGGATGESSLAVRFTDHGSTACVLEGRPAVEFLDSTGNPVGLREDENGAGKQYVSGTSAAAYRLQPGSSVDIVIGKYRCDLGVDTVATEVKIGLPEADKTTTLIIKKDAEVGQIASCQGGNEDPGQTFAISGYRTFKCHLVGNATGGGWCEGELGKQPAQTPDQAAAAETEEPARR